MEDKYMPFNFLEFWQLMKLKASIKNPDELLEEYMTWGRFPLICNYW